MSSYSCTIYQRGGGIDIKQDIKPSTQLSDKGFETYITAFMRSWEREGFHPVSLSDRDFAVIQHALSSGHYNCIAFTLKKPKITCGIWFNTKRIRFQHPPIFPVQDTAAKVHRVVSTILGPEEKTFSAKEAASEEDPVVSAFLASSAFSQFWCFSSNLSKEKTYRKL